MLTVCHWMISNYKILIVKLTANAEFTGYKNGEPVQNTLENYITDPASHIPSTLGNENTLTDDLLLLQYLKLKSYYKNGLRRIF